MLSLMTVTYFQSRSNFANVKTKVHDLTVLVKVPSALLLCFFHIENISNTLYDFHVHFKEMVYMFSNFMLICTVYE